MEPASLRVIVRAFVRMRSSSSLVSRSPESRTPMAFSSSSWRVVSRASRVTRACSQAARSTLASVTGLTGGVRQTYPRVVAGSCSGESTTTGTITRRAASISPGSGSSRSSTEAGSSAAKCGEAPGGSSRGSRSSGSSAMICPPEKSAGYHTVPCARDMRLASKILVVMVVVRPGVLSARAALAESAEQAAHEAADRPRAPTEAADRSADRAAERAGQPTHRPADSAHGAPEGAAYTAHGPAEGRPAEAPADAAHGPAKGAADTPNRAAEGATHSSPPEGSAERAAQSADRPADGAGQPTDRPADAGHRATERVGEPAGRVTHRAGEAGHRATEAFEAQAVHQVFQDLLGGSRDAAHDVLHGLDRALDVLEGQGRSLHRGQERGREHHRAALLACHQAARELAGRIRLTHLPRLEIR